MSTRHDSVQLLRGVAALLVVVHHAISTDPGGGDGLRHLILPGVPAFAGFGAVGVDLFFVISGFVMANSLATADAGRFLLHRAIRILPLFWLVSAAMIVQQGCVGIVPSWQGLANTMTLVPLFDGGVYHYPPLFVGWTLGFECAFYALVTVAIATRRPAAWLMVMTVLCALIGAFIGHPPIGLRFLFNPITAEFALGVLVWIGWQRGIADRWAKLAMVAGTVLLLSGLCIDVGQGFATDPSLLIGGETGLHRLIVWGLPAALILTGLVADPTTSGGRGAMAAIGDASYSLYLVHPLVIAVGFMIHLPDRLGNPYVVAAVLVAGSVGTGIALHRAVERPMLAAMRRWAYRSSNRGISSTKLHGRWRLSSWSRRMPSHPSFTAPVEPGSANT